MVIHPIDYCEHLLNVVDIELPLTWILGELFDIITAKSSGMSTRSLSEGSIRRFAKDIIAGMGCLTDHGINHRDLKPENMLIDETGHVVIIDMGHAKMLDADKLVEATPLGSALEGSFSAKEEEDKFLETTSLGSAPGDSCPPEGPSEAACSGFQIPPLQIAPEGSKFKILKF